MGAREHLIDRPASDPAGTPPRRGFAFSAAKASCIALAVAALFAVTASGATAGDLRVAGAFAGATPGAVKTGAVYLKLANAGTEPERLLGASTPVAERVEMHQSTMDNGVMTMREVDEVTVDPGATVELSPGGTHLMLIGLHAPLRQGDSFPLTLHMAEAGDLKVDVAVKRPGARNAE